MTVIIDRFSVNFNNNVVKNIVYYIFVIIVSPYQTVCKVGFTNT